MDYVINNGTLEAKMTISQELRSKDKEYYRRRIRMITYECTRCRIFYIMIKNVKGTILMSEIYEL